MPTRSAILLATRMPSFPSSSSNICVIASNSENDNVLIADLTIATLRSSSALSSLTERIISSPTTVVPYSVRIISSISYSLSLRYSKRVPSLSPAISIGVIIARYLRDSSPKPKVSRLTFSFVERIPSNRSFKSGSMYPPTSSTINSCNSSTPLQTLEPRTLPFLLITRISESRIPVSTSQISLKTTFDELLL